MDATLGNLLASTAIDLSGFFTGLSRIREESNKIGTVQVKARIDTTAMRDEIARTSTSWKDLQGIADQATRTMSRNLGGAGNEATNLRNQLRQAGSEFRTMDSDAAATKIKVAGIVAEARTLKAGFESGTAEARVLTSVIEQGRAALGTARSSTSPVINQLRQEQASARAATQEVNNYRIAWQRKANDDATTAGIMKRLEAGILSQKNAIDAEIASLRNLGVLEEQDQARVNALIAQRNTYNTALRTTSSVQLTIAGEIQKGGLAAGVAMGTQAAATRGLTAEVDRLTAAEKLGLITKKELSVALLTETTAHRVTLTAIQAEMLGLRELGVLDAQQSQRLLTLALDQDRYTAALLRSTTAQREAAQAGNLLRAGAMGAGASGKLNGAAMGLSFVSPELGMGAMLLQMGPAIAGIAAGFLAVGAAIKTVSSGMNDFANWNRQMTQLQALTHLSGEDIQGLSSYFRQLSTEVPISAKELGEFGRQAVLVGIHGAEGIKTYTRDIANLSIILRDANGQSQGVVETGQEIVKVLRATGVSDEGLPAAVTRLTDSLVALKTESGVAIPQVAQLLKFWASQGSHVGLTVEQMTALSTALIQTGARAQGAGGALATFFDKATAGAAAGGAKMEAWARVVGLSADEAAKLLKQDPMEFMRRFVTGANELDHGGQALSTTLGSVGLNSQQVRRTIAELSLAMPLLAKNTKIAEDASTNGGTAMKTAAEAAKSYKDQVIELGHQWDNFKLSLGAAFVPMANDVLTYINNIIKAMKGMAAFGAEDRGMESWLKQTGLKQSDMSPDQLERVNELLRQRQVILNGNAIQKTAIGNLPISQSAKDAQQASADAEATRRLGELGVKLGALQAEISQGLTPGTFVGVGPLQRGQTRAESAPASFTNDKAAVIAAAAAKLGINPNYLATVISFETAGTFDQAVKNPDSSATGLIQFMKGSGGTPGKYYGMSREQFGGQTFEQQMQYVIKYLRDRGIGASKGSLGDIYNAVAGSGYRNGSDEYNKNKVWDTNGDGYIAPGEAVQAPKFQAHARNYFTGQPLGEGASIGARKIGSGGTTDPKLDAEGRALYAAYVQTMGSGNSDEKIIGRMREFKKKHKDLWDSIVADAKAAAKDLKASGVSSADYNKWMAPAQRMAQLQKDTRVGGKVQSDADNKIAAWVKASGGDNSVAKKVLDYEVSAFSQANKGTKEYIASTAELNKWRAAALPIAQRQVAASTSTSDAVIGDSAREVASFTKDSKVKASVLKMVTESLKNQEAAEQQAAKVREAAQAGDVTLAKQELDRLTSQRDVKLALAKDSASQRLQVENDYAKSVYQAGVDLADAQLKQAQAVANDPKKTDPGNRVQALEIAEHDHTQALQKALDERNARTSSARAENLKETQKYADASKQLDIEVMTSSASRLTQLNDAKLESVKDNLTKVSSLTKVFAKDEYDRSVAIAEATRQKTIAAAQVEGGPNRQKNIDAANEAYRTAESSARGIRDKSIADAKKAALDQQKVFADASRQLDVETMSSSATRLKTQNAATLDLIKDNLTKRAALTKQFGEDEYKRQVAIAQAEYDRAVKALNPKDPNYGKAVSKLDNDLTTATSAAEIARVTANRAAQDAITKSVQASRDEYKALAQGIRDKVAAGTLDDKSMAEAVAKLDELAKKTALAGTSNSTYLLTARQSAKATYQAGIDAQIASGSYDTMADSFDRTSKVQNKYAVSTQAALDKIPGGVEARQAYIQSLIEESKAGRVSADTIDAVTRKIADLNTIEALNARAADEMVKSTLDTAAAFKSVGETNMGLDVLQATLGMLIDLSDAGQDVVDQMNKVIDAINNFGVDQDIQREVDDFAGSLADIGPNLGNFQGSSEDLAISLNDTLGMQLDAINEKMNGLTDPARIAAFKKLKDSLLDTKQVLDNVYANPEQYADGARGFGNKPAPAPVLDDPATPLDNFDQQLEGIRKNRLKGAELQKWLGTLDPEQLKQANAVLLVAHQEMLDVQTAQLVAALEKRKTLGLVTEKAYLTEKGVLDARGIESEFVKATVGLAKTDQAYLLAAATRQQKLEALTGSTGAALGMIARTDRRSDQDRQAQQDRDALERLHTGNLVEEQTYLTRKAALNEADARRVFIRAQEDHLDLMQAGKTFNAAKLKIQADLATQLEALDKKDRRSDQDRDLQQERESVQRSYDGKLIDQASYLTQMAALDQRVNQTTLDRAAEDHVNQVQALAEFNAQKLKIQEDLATKLATLGTGDTRAIEDANAKSALDTLNAQHTSHLISDKQFYDDKRTLDRATADRELARAKADHQNLQVAEAVHTAVMKAIDAQYGIDTVNLSLSRTRALEDIESQSQQTQLGLLKQRGLDEVSYINASEQLDIAAARRTLARAIQDGKDQVEAEAQYQAQLTGIQNKANADRLSADPLYKGVEAIFNKAQTDQTNFIKGVSSSKEYGAAMLENAAALEVFAKNLEKLGSPEAKQAAEILRSFAQGYKNLTPEVSKTTAALTKGLNTLSDWAGAAGQVSGALGNLAGALGETEQEYDSLTGKKLETPWKDLSANLTGAGKAFNTLASIATDAMAVIANPLDIKAWGKLLVNIISSIADALAGFKKAAAEVQKNKDDFQDQNPLLNGKDYQRTYTRSRGVFADYFGGGPEVVNEIDKIGLKAAKTIADSVYNGLDAAFKKYAETGNLADFQKALTNSIVDGFKQGLIDAFKDDPARKATFANDIKAYTDAKKSGDKEGMATALTGLKLDAQQTTKDAKELLETLDEIDKANGTGRYDPAVLAAAKNKLDQERVNNEQTLDGLKNRNDLAQLSRDERAARLLATTDEQRTQVEIEFAQKRLVINEAYERRKLAVALKGIQLQMESELAATGLTEEQKEVIREKYRLQSEGANQDFTDFLDGAQNDIADKQAAAIKTLADAAASAAKQAADAIKAEQDGFINNWSQIGSTAFVDGLNAANFDTFFNNFRTNIMKSVLEGTVAGLFKSIAEDRLRPFAERYRQALLTPGTGDDLSALADLRNGITMLSSDLKPVFDSLSPAFADLKSELAANTAATQENTQATREQEFGTTIARFATIDPTPGLTLRNMMPL